MRQPQPVIGTAAAVPGYYQFARPELLALVPESAERVLDVGCGAGRLGEAIKKRQPAKVTGIEFVPEAAAHARGLLDEVFEGDVERLSLPFKDAAFDCVVCGDVLEHLREPEQFLRRVRRLARSRWSYRGQSAQRSPSQRGRARSWKGTGATSRRDSLMRRTSVSSPGATWSIFLSKPGFEVVETRMVPGPGYEEWQRSGCPGEVRVGRLHIADTRPEEAEEFFVYQYLIVARPRKTASTREFVENGNGFHKKHGHDAANPPLNLAINGRNEDCPADRTD